VLFFFPVGG
jgi:hypothetical protein